MSTHDPLDLTAIDARKEEKAKREKFEAESEKADFVWLMQNKRGRRFVWRLLDQSGTFRISFSTQAMQMAFNEGNRNMGNRLLALIHTYCPELYPVLVKENTNVGHADRS